MKKNTIYVFLLFSTLLYAQIQNSNKEQIADFYDASSKRLTLNGGQVDVQFRLTELKRNWVDASNKKIANNDSPLKTAEKVSGLFLDLGLVNTASFTDLDAIDWNKIGYKFGLTWQNAFSKVYFDENCTKVKYPFLTSWKLSLTGTFDRFDNYDPNTNTIDNTMPFRGSLSGNISRYCFSNKDNFWAFHVVPTFNGRVNFVDFNNLDNYILNSNTTTNSTVTITSNSSFDGKFGTIDNNQQSSFLSFSLPMISKRSLQFKKDKPIVYFVPIPHVSWQTFENDKPKINTGFSLGLLPKSLFGEDNKTDLKDDGKTPIDNTFYRDFNAPSFLSVGVDWNFQGGNSSKPQYYISGTFFIR